MRILRTSYRDCVCAISSTPLRGQISGPWEQDRYPFDGKQIRFDGGSRRCSRSRSQSASVHDPPPVRNPASAQSASARGPPPLATCSRSHSGFSLAASARVLGCHPSTGGASQVYSAGAFSGDTALTYRYCSSCGTTSFVPVGRTLPFF